MESTHQSITRHPIRGAIYGLLLGIGVAIYLVIFSIVRYGEWLPLALVVALCVGLGVVWAYLAPPKKPKDTTPDPATTAYTADEYAQTQTQPQYPQPQPQHPEPPQ